ncbi:MAG: glycine cleavage T C-terminal barrel domain-containing protein [Acidimicrobiales bacterium]
MAETLATTYEAIRAAAAWRVVRRDGVLVSGPGALDWLQGQVSQDLSQLQVAPEAGGASVETLVLSPQGKIESSCRVSVVGPDRYLLDVRAGYGEVLFERLRRFKLRVKAELETLAGLSALQVRGPATPQVAELSLRVPALAVVAVTWPLWSGLDVLFQGELDGIEHVEPAVSVGPGDDEAFEAARIEAGVPELGLELTERTIPQESGELVARTVSFTKGCYTGQELVARVDARGANTPRRLHGVVITDAVRPAGGDEILVDGVAVGALTSVAWSPGFAAHVALAAVKRGTETTHEAQVIGAGGSARASIRSLPMVSG